MDADTPQPKKSFDINPSVAIVLAGVIIAGAVLYTNAHPAPAAVADAAGSNLPASVNVPPPKASDHIEGSPNAPIVLIEYADFQCPYCAQVYPTIKNIVDNSNGQIAWVMRSFPLTSIHPLAAGAATAAECIAALGGNDDYWKYVDAVYTNQAQLGTDYERQLALSFGISASAYDNCIAQNPYQARITGDSGDAIASGGQGTPYTVVYSASYQAAIPGALPADQFNAVIQSVKNRQTQ